MQLTLRGVRRGARVEDVVGLAGPRTGGRRGCDGGRGCDGRRGGGSRHSGGRVLAYIDTFSHSKSDNKEQKMAYHTKYDVNYFQWALTILPYAQTSRFV